MNQLKPQMKLLADLNQEHRVCGMYHTHSGPGMIGGPIWDLWTMFQTLNPQWIGVNYDIGHATVEGGYGGWIASSRLVKDSMRGIALKDFSWGRNEKSSTHQDPYDKSLGIEGAWVPHWCAMGQGMVNFAGFFAIVKQNRFSGPVQLHFEHPGLGGAENGDKTLRIPKQELISAMREIWPTPEESCGIANWSEYASVSMFTVPKPGCPISRDRFLVGDVRSTRIFPGNSP